MSHPSFVLNEDTAAHFKDAMVSADRVVVRQSSSHRLAGEFHRSRQEKCIQCGQLDVLCRCDNKARIDKDRVRDALSSVSMNTPFFRAKLAKHFDAVSQAEQRARVVVRQMRSEELVALAHAEAAARAVTAVHGEEDWGRRRIISRCVSGLRSLDNLFHHGVAATLLQQDETRHREAWAARCSAAYHALQAQCDASLAVALCARDESTERCARWSDQVTAWCELLERESIHRGAMTYQGRERAEALRQTLCRREALEEVERDTFASLQLAFVRGVDTIEACYVDRAALEADAVTALRRCTTHEAAERQELRHHFNHCTEALSDYLAAQGGERMEFVAAESVSRGDHVLTEVAAREVLLRMKLDGHEAALQVTAAKTRLRGEALSYAEDALRRITSAELDARHDLMCRMEEEAELRGQFAAKLAADRQQFWHYTVQQVTVLVQQEERKREILEQQMLDNEVQVAHWLETRDEQITAFLDLENEERRAVYVAVRDTLSLLKQQDLAGRDRVEEWLRATYQLRHTFYSHEYAVRHDVEAAETTARDALAVARVEDTERVRAITAAKRRAVEALCDDEFNARDALEVALAEACDTLEVMGAASLDFAVTSTQFREKRAVLEQERRHRNKVSLGEVEARSAILALMAGEAQRHSAEERLVLEALLNEVADAEQSIRDVKRSEEAKAFFNLSVAVTQGHNAAMARQREREHTELVARQVQMVEARRQYDDDEEACVGRSSFVNFRRSCLLVPGDDSSAKKDFIAQELQEDCAGLTPGAAAFVFDLLEKSAALRDAHAADLKRTKTAAAELQDKRLPRLEAVLLSKREQVASYTSMLEKDRHKFDAMVQSEREHTKREVKQYRLEEQKLKETAQKLTALKAEVGQLKDAIHTAYRRM